LVGLAQRLVALDRETTEVRAQMLTLLAANGAGGDPVPANLPGRGLGPASKRGSKPKARSAKPAKAEKPFGRRDDLLEAAKAAEDKIVALLKDKPAGMRSKEIAAATGSKTSTLTERSKRLRAKGLVAPVEGGGWAATATA
jgi:hypothetical protein